MTEPWNDGLAGILDTPEMRRQRVFDTLTGLGTALYAASQPSPYPRDVVGPALIGMAANNGRSEESAMRRAMLGMQIAKQRQEQIGNEEIAKYLEGGGRPVAPAAPAPEPMPQGGGGDYYSNVRGSESGNKFVPNALGSGAWGPSQIMPDTWATIATKNPQLGLPFNMRQATPQQYAEAEKALVQMNAAGLKAQGIEPNAQNLYLAHRFGVGGTKQFLSADPNKQIAELFPSWIAQNPDLRTTVGAFRQGVQGRYGSVPSPVAQGDANVIPVQATGQPQPTGGPLDNMDPRKRDFLAKALRSGKIDVRSVMLEISKDLSPEWTAAIDQRGQVVFAPKNKLNQYTPLQANELALKQREADLREANSEVLPGGRLNQPLVDVRKAVSAAQGTDPGTKITVELAQDAIKRNAGWQDAGMKAQSSLQRLGALQTLLDQVTTGRFKGTTTEIKAAAKGAGIDLEALGVKDDVGPTQAIQALSNMMSLENRDPSGGAGMPGAMSDADRNFLQQASPGITKDPAGNKLLIEIKRGDLQRQVDAAKYAREYIKSAEFKTNPAGLDDYVAAKLAEKSYYNPDLLKGVSPAHAPAPAAPAGSLAVPQSGAVRKYNPATGRIE